MANESVKEREKGRFNFAFVVRALKYSNYRLFFGGQGLSLVGTWITRVATGWLVYRLTDSALLLGIVAFASQIPILFLGPFAGVWVDRWDRHRVLVVTQVLSMIQSFCLAALTLWGSVNIYHIIGLMIFQGVVNSFDMPARQAFVFEMVENREDLPNAIALNSSLVNATRLIGPSVAGLIIAAVGEGWCFMIDGISYIAVIISLLAMKVTRREIPPATTSVWQELKEGWNYVADSAPIHSILLLLSIVSLVSMPYTVLMPVFAVKLPHGGPHTLGYLMSAAGLGALMGAISLAARKSVLGLGKVIVFSTMTFGLAIIAFSFSRMLWLSLLLLVVSGFGMMQQMAAGNTIMQTIVEEDKRGRVMSFFSISLMGVAPFGSLMAGWAAARIGAPATLVIGGIVCISAAGAFAARLPMIRKVVRPIYRELGIIPEVASGIQSASLMQTPPED